ncbi:MAG: hypothetical protein QOH03_1149 [Kribbellaceae bacterium]|nr:hypothetical protein [Kribbellaceae bacterium]
MGTAESENDGRNSCQKQQQDGAKCSDHAVQPATVSILSQLRKYETGHSVIIRLLFTLVTAPRRPMLGVEGEKEANDHKVVGLPSTGGPPERSQ